jgi:hypothetical protein
MNVESDKQTFRGNKQMATSKKTVKEVQVLCKYSHKKNGQLTGVVTYAVRSSRTNERYYVTLVDGKATACNCPSRKTCYHITQLEKLEADRKVVATQFSAKSVPAWMMNLVNTGKLVAPAAPAKSADNSCGSKDLGKVGSLNGAAQSNAMPAWLSILPSRQQALAS